MNNVIVAAIHNTICPNSLKYGMPDPCVPNNNINNAAIWMKVLILARRETGTLTWISAKNSLRPATANSLVRIRMHGSSFTFSNFASIMRMVPTRILSAIGSSIFPKLLSILNLRAIYPSKKSVIQAIKNKKAESWWAKVVSSK